MGIDPDIDAMERLCAGDELALRGILDRWQEPVIGYLIREVGLRHEAVDLAQEVFVRVYRYRHHFEARGRFSTWLYAIAANLARNHRRWRARHPAVPLDAPPGEAEGSAAPSERIPDPGRRPDEEAVAREQAAAVRRAVDSLPDEVRTALLLHEYQGLALADIARIQGCSARAVEGRLYRARVQLRGMLGLE